MTTVSQTLANLVHQRTGTRPLDCYQCGRCAAGCPQNVPGEMDISPTRIMRLLQLEAAFAVANLFLRKGIIFTRVDRDGRGW